MPAQASQPESREPERAVDFQAVNDPQHDLAHHFGQQVSEIGHSFVTSIFHRALS
jgi:hypothetical protein